MERIIPMSLFNQVLIALSILSASLCLVIQEWADISPLPIYASIVWCIVVITGSIWLSFYLLKLTLKINEPLNVEFINKWLYAKLASSLNLGDLIDKNAVRVKEKSKEKRISNSKGIPKEGEQTNRIRIRRIPLKGIKVAGVNDMIKEINEKCINSWYKNISSEKTFPDEAQELLKKLLTRLLWKVNLIDKIKLTHKLGNILLLHLKEYQRALRRVEKGTASTVEEAYKCLHPGSRSVPALEHMMHRLVTVLAQEFLQWELTSSSPCKLLLSILAKKLSLAIETMSQPDWLLQNLYSLLQSMPKEVVNAIEVSATDSTTNPKASNTKGAISNALSEGMTSATAAVIPRPLPTSNDASATVSENKITVHHPNVKRPTLCLENIGYEHRGLWGRSASEVDSELDEDRMSPVYEESTDFASTIAKLRSVLQQKSNVTTPLQVEEKSYVICEGSQFTNLSIPWTEFHTASDGSQQLLYCIQFDDVEQRSVDLFETTTATVRRQYSDFAQLHASLEEIPSLARIMSDLVLPEGGRVELETYLKILCTRLANECPPQLRHFLRPNSIAGKKADAVAPRFDRFLAKTVSGVVNTLRTVVPGFDVEQDEDNVPLPTLMPLSDIPWRFVEDIKSRSLALELQQLVAERAEYCSVDTAYEAVDSGETIGDTTSLAHWWEIMNTTYHDEVDELDSCLALTCTALDLMCELLTAIGSNNTLQQEAVIRWMKLLFGNVTEPILQEIILVTSTRFNGISLPGNMQNDKCAESPGEMKKRLLNTILARIPYNVKLILGEEDLQKIFEYLLNSREIKKINRDLNLQILDVLASELLVSCRTTHESVAHQ